MTCDKEFKKFTSDAAWEGMAVAEQFSIGGASLKSAITMISPFIWDGNVSLALQNTQIYEEGEKFDLANMKVDYILSYDKEHNTLSAKAEYGADSLSVGPDTISKIFARIGINGVDAKGYEEFMKLYTATVSAILGDITAAKDDPEKMKQILEKKMAMVGFQMVAAGEKLLTKDLQLQISDLHLQVPDGEITGDATHKPEKRHDLCPVYPGCQPAGPGAGNTFPEIQCQFAGKTGWRCPHALCPHLSRYADRPLCEKRCKRPA